jgi:arylformamidase
MALTILNMYRILLSCTLFCLFLRVDGHTQTNAKTTAAYMADGHPRHGLDIYGSQPGEKRPVVFWIHGGGWQTGSKSDVKAKPDWFVSKGFLFVSINYRLLPEVDMETLTQDVARAFGWVHANIDRYGGDPSRILVAGHSAGAQLAALLSTDERYLRAEGASLKDIIGCIPVDGDTYDIPAIIETAETRRRVHHLPQSTFGHREKFGNSAEKHRDFSAVTHVQSGKSIPPFLILYVSNHPDTSAQAARLGAVLREAGVSTQMFAGKDTDHVKLNNLLGAENDAATAALETFLSEITRR